MEKKDMKPEREGSVLGVLDALLVFERSVGGVGPAGSALFLVLDGRHTRRSPQIHLDITTVIHSIVQVSLLAWRTEVGMALSVWSKISPSLVGGTMTLFMAWNSSSVCQIVYYFLILISSIFFLNFFWIFSWIFEFFFIFFFWIISWIFGFFLNFFWIFSWIFGFFVNFFLDFWIFILF